MLVHHSEHLQPWIAEPPAIRSLHMLNQHRRQFVEQLKRCKLKLASCLKGSFPQALQWFADLASKPALLFLQRCPILEQAKRVQLRTLVRFLGGARAQARAQHLKQQIRQARALHQDDAVLEVHVLQVQALLLQIRQLVAIIQDYEQRIAQRFAQQKLAAVFESFPGAGPVQAPRLLVALGTRKDRFQSPQQLAAFAGIAPITRASGKSRLVVWRWACNKFLRQSFHEFAQCSIPWSKWARARYHQLRARGKGHHSAVRALAFKWIRILYRCWKDEVPYDEQTHIQSLIRSNSSLLPWIEKLDSCEKPMG